MELSLHSKRSYPSDKTGAQLLADAQLRDDGAITLDVLLHEVVEQAAAFTDHFVHSESAVFVSRVGFQMLCEFSDTLCQYGDLYLRRACVSVVSLVGLNDGCLFFFCDHFLFPFSIFLSPMAKYKVSKGA